MRNMLIKCPGFGANLRYHLIVHWSLMARDLVIILVHRNSSFISMDSLHSKGAFESLVNAKVLVKV